MKNILICLLYLLFIGSVLAEWGDTCLIATCNNVYGYDKQGDLLVSILKKEGINAELCYAVKVQGVTAIGAQPDKAEFWQLFVPRTESEHAERLLREQLQPESTVKLCHIDM